MQPTINHQMMGYDRAITMFSPDGRLLQVEYAKKMVKQGSTAIGMVCKDGVLLVTDKRIVDQLIVSESVEKIFQIDDHLGATAAGLLSDARLLIENAQVKAQQNRVSYDSPVDILSIIRSISSIKQMCTQSGGLRPFGVSLLIMGVDETGPKLYVSEPAGIYFQYYAAVIGEGEQKVEEILHKDYKRTLTIEQGLALAVKALRSSIGKDFSPDRIDAAYIKSDKPKFTKLSRQEVERLLKK